MFGKLDKAIARLFLTALLISVVITPTYAALVVAGVPALTAIGVALISLIVSRVCFPLIDKLKD